MLRTFEEAVRRSDLPNAVKAKVPSALHQRVEAFRELAANRTTTGSRVQREVIRGIRKTLRQLVRAVRHASAHDDGNVRQQARELIRSVQYESFEDVQQRASSFVGLLNKAGHRRKELARRSERKRYPIGSEMELVELNSVDMLKSAGRKLELCVGRADSVGRGYHDALRSGDSEFYCLEREGQTLGLLELDLGSESIEALEGKNGSTLKLSRDDALRVLRELDATADSVGTFARVGAFSPFVAAKLAPDVFESEGVKYAIWCFPSEPAIIVRTRRRTRSRPVRPARRTRGRPVSGSWTWKPSWSLFKPLRRRRSSGRSTLLNWYEVSGNEHGMDVGELLDLALRCPALAQRLGDMHR